MIDSILPAGTGLTGSAGSKPKDDPEKMENAARQFEALLITQLLRSARGGEAGWLGAGEDSASSSAIEMAEEFLGQSLAAQGGMGLSRVVVDGLKKTD